MSPFLEIAIQPPQQVRIGNSPVQADRPTRVSHATVPSSSGPAHKHTTKFEPDSWRWAHMTSGSGPPKRILSEESIQIQTLEIKLSTYSASIADPGSEN